MEIRTSARYRHHLDGQVSQESEHTYEHVQHEHSGSISPYTRTSSRYWGDELSSRNDPSREGGCQVAADGAEAWQAPQTHTDNAVGGFAPVHTEPPEYENMYPDANQAIHELSTLERHPEGSQEHEHVMGDWKSSSNRRSRSKLKVLKLWTVEIMAIIVATGLLAAICCILAAYNGQRTSSWKQMISLNTLVATLSTISRIALVTTASEIISQIKWSWFWSGNAAHRIQGVPLEDVERFDEASRGVWGSIQLITRSLCNPTLMLTLIVVLFSVAMGSFAQQAVQTINCEYAGDTGAAVIPNAHTLGDIGRTRPFSASNLNINKPLNFAVKAGILSSLTDPTGNDSIIQATCTTGNCTFPVLQDINGQRLTHRSIGFCSQCVDISSHITHNSTETGREDNIMSTETRSWFLPNGQEVYEEKTLQHQASGYVHDSITVFLHISTTSLDFNWSSAISNNADQFLNASRYAFLNVSFISIDNFTAESQSPLPVDPKVSATVCTLYPCLKSYLAAIDKGNYVEELVSTEDLKPYGDLLSIRLPTGSYQGSQVVFPSDMVTIRTPCIVAGQTYTETNLSSAPGAATLSRLDFGTRLPFTQLDVGQDMPTINITAPPECLFAMDHVNWFDEIRSFLADALQGSCGAWGVFGRSTPCAPPPVSGGKTPGMEPFWLESLASMPYRTRPDAARYMDAVAESLTRKFRMGLNNGAGAGEAESKWHVTGVQGTAWQTTTCFSIEWMWLLLPSALTLIVAVVLALVLIRYTCGRGREEMMWKSSILPFFYHQERFVAVGGQGSTLVDEKQDWNPLLELADMRRDAKYLKVVFQG